MCFARISSISLCLGTGCFIDIEIMIIAVSQQHTSDSRDFSDEILSFHTAKTISLTLCFAGTSAIVIIM
jgi:hypothetical protein